MKKLKQMYRCMEEWMSGNGETTGCPTKTLGHDRRCGFTLVELVIVIAIVIILSVISIPIYRGYVDKSKMAEGYALLGTILSAQKAYYSQYGNFLKKENTSYNGWTSKEDVLGIDARGNKYFKQFLVDAGYSNIKYSLHAEAHKIVDDDLRRNSTSMLVFDYNITTGVKFFEK